MMNGCSEILSQEKIIELLENNKSLIDKYNKFYLNAMILNDKNKKFCPVINCGGYGSYIGDLFLACNNNHKFCFNCLKKWHKGKDCDEIIDKDFEKWKKGKMIKQCPSCKFWTEKNEGCNHMTCRACSFQWCWICGNEYLSNHYQQGACVGLQYSKILLILNIFKLYR
jgi:hypothetical protein